MSSEFPFSLSKWFHKSLYFYSVCTCVLACVYRYMCACVSLLPSERFSSGFSLVFLFFLFYFFKIIFPLKQVHQETSSPPTTPDRPQPSFFLNRADFPSHPQTGTPQDGLWRLESLPVWRDAVVAVKAPLPQWRFLIVGHSLVFVFFLSSN